MYIINQYAFNTFIYNAAETLAVSPVFSTNKTDRHDIAEILLKVLLNTITHTLPPK